MKKYLFTTKSLKGLFIALFILALIFPLKATNYYVDASDGNDSNNGTSLATPWQTLEKVSNSAFSPGDSILFKRGEMWRGYIIINESGTSSSPIVFGAYGEGKKPLFLQSVTKNNTSDWTSISTNQWATANGSFPSDVGFMLLGEERADNVGIRRESSDPIDNDKEYWYDGTNDRVILYCTQNPASVYSSIEIPYTISIYNHFIGTSNSYLHFENLDIRYFNSHAMAFTNSKGIEVRHCHISYGGGCHRPSDRYGNGVEFWLSSSDCIVENCRVGQLYDSGVTPQAASKAATVDNVTFRNNILYGNGISAFEIGFMNSATTLSDIYFYNNICLGNGYGWSQYQRPEVYIGWDICTWKSSVKSWDGFYVNNNVFYEPNSFVMYFDAQTRPTNYKQDHNYFYKSTGIRPSLIYYTYSNRYLMEEFTTYQSDKGQDLNSGWGSRSEAQKIAREKVACEDLFFLNTLFQEYDDSTLTGKAPSVFDLVSPADGSSVNGQAVLSWEESTGNTSPIDHYEVWID
jgi:hypothetical protein